MDQKMPNHLPYHKKLEQGLQLAKTGKIDAALSYFEKIIWENPMEYGAYINLTTLCLQGGQLEKAQVAALKAISIDPFHYMGYYNLFALLNYNLDPQNIKNPQLILKALSCIYSHLGQKQKDKKMLNKSLSYCEDNSKAYLFRAQLSLSLGKKVLAKNDYQAAIFHSPDIPFLYLKKAEFEWKNKNYQQGKAAIEEYWKLKAKRQKIGNIMPQKIDQIGITAREWTEEEQTSMQKTVQQKFIQFEQLLQKLNQQQNQMAKNPQQIRAVEQKQQNAQKQKQGINRSIQQLTSKKIDQIFISDESSKNLTLEIQNLEKQIKDQGGNLSIDTSQNQTFLTQDIESAVRDIESMKKLDLPSPNNKSAKSSYSHITINEEDLQQFQKIKIQIVSAQSFDDHEKDEGKVNLSYGSYKVSTERKKDKLWREKFEFSIDHRELKPIYVQLQMKSGSIWSTKKIIGRGQISILSNGDNKVILTDGEKKTCIVYFKLKLMV